MYADELRAPSLSFRVLTPLRLLHRSNSAQRLLSQVFPSSGAYTSLHTNQKPPALTAQRCSPTNHPPALPSGDPTTSRPEGPNTSATLIAVPVEAAVKRREEESGGKRQPSRGKRLSCPGSRGSRASGCPATHEDSECLSARQSPRGTWSHPKTASSSLQLRNLRRGSWN